MAHINFAYSIFKSYLRFWHDHIFYTQTYTLGKENIPADGTPLLIVSNHQNCLNDPLGVLFSFRDRKANFITRADVFAIHPIANKFLRAIGLLPAFRLNHEGAEALKNNAATFKMSEQALLDGATVMLFPEAGHQDRHWLGTFSFGYTRLAFEAAEEGNFEKEIFILPSCNHYSDYFGIRNRFMVRFGTPISLKPYYELYQCKPRTAQREVNKLVRAQIKSMMLDIEDTANYETIDFIRNTYGKNYASVNGNDPENLPARLKSDQEIVAALAGAKENDPETAERLYERFKTYAEELKDCGFDDNTLTSTKGRFTLVTEILMELALLPAWIFSLWPSLLMYYIPRPFSQRTGDKMFQGTFLFALNMLFIVPVTAILTFVVEGLQFSWWLAALHVLLFPALCIFAWNYKERVKKTAMLFKKLFSTDSRKLDELHETRNTLWEETTRIIRNKSKR